MNLLGMAKSAVIGYLIKQAIQGANAGRNDPWATRTPTGSPSVAESPPTGSNFTAPTSFHFAPGANVSCLVTNPLFAEGSGGIVTFSGFTPLLDSNRNCMSSEQFFNQYAKQKVIDPYNCVTEPLDVPQTVIARQKNGEGTISIATLPEGNLTKLGLEMVRRIAQDCGFEAVASAARAIKASVVTTIAVVLSWMLLILK